MNNEIYIYINNVYHGTKQKEEELKNTVQNKNETEKS